MSKFMIDMVGLGDLIVVPLRIGIDPTIVPLRAGIDPIIAPLHNAIVGMDAVGIGKQSMEKA